MAAEQETQWFALRVFNNKVFKMENLLKDRGVECYVPVETVVVERNGVRKKERRPVISSLMFVKTESLRIKEIEGLGGIGMSFYKRKKEDGSREAAPIPRHEMEMFILVTSAGENGLEYYDGDKLNLSVGNRVRVIDGIFKGTEGYIKRIKGNRRFIVSINGVCAVATPYIPVAFLQKIED